MHVASIPRGLLYAAPALLFAFFGLAACSSNSTTPQPAPTATATFAPGGPVAGSPISHVIIVVQENRTMDNLFASSYLTSGHGYPGADTTPVGMDSNRDPVTLSPVPFEDPYDPSHSHPSLVTEWNNGTMNGFNLDTTTPALPGLPATPANYPYAFVPPSETLLYHLFAYQYALADEMFSSRLVPSFPGHLYLIAGQSDPADDPTDNNVWGCDSATGTTVPVFTTPGSEAIATPGVYPCFNYQTLGDLLDAKHVSWKYYTGQIGNTVDGQVNTYDAIQHIRNGPDWTANISTPATNILSDIQNCNLPSVSWVTPPALASDHAGNLSNAGPGWVGSIYLQMVESSGLQTKPACQYYGNTAMIITWDDSGGWYDHVAPPADAAGNRYGFRVPLIVASAFATSGYTAAHPTGYLPFVSHQQREFGSIIRYVEKNFGLGSLGQRDQNADDLHDMFTYTQTPIPPIPASKIRAQIAATSWNRVKNERSTRPVDDDK